MSNSLLTPRQIIKEAMFLLSNELIFTKTLQNRSSEFTGAKTGFNLDIRKPMNFQTVQANDISGSIRDAIEDKVTLTIDAAPISIPIEFTDQELELQISDFSERVLKPAMESMGSQVEYKVMTKIIPAVNNLVNSANFDFAATTAIRTRMQEKLAPKERSMLTTAGQSAQLRTDVKSLFITPKEAFEDGAIGTVSGMKLYESELLPTQATGSRTNGTISATPAQGATSIALAGVGASGTVKVGEVFTVASTYNVNWYTKETKTTLYQFSVIAPADPTVDGAAGGWVAATQAYTASAGVVTVNISEPYYGPSATGYRQKMSRNVVATDVVTFVGTASSASIAQGLVYAKALGAVAFLDLPTHKNMDQAASETHQGIKLRYQRDYTLSNNKNLARLDVQLGAVMQQPEYGCRFWSIA